MIGTSSSNKDKHDNNDNHQLDLGQIIEDASNDDDDSNFISSCCSINCSSSCTCNA